MNLPDEMTDEQVRGLAIARHLAEHGVPVFVAKPDGSPLGFRLPSRWQQTKPNPSVVDQWWPGMALCMVTGVLVDAIDVDPRNGGNRDALTGTMPKTYGEAASPSGGSHDLIATLGVRTCKPFTGVDLKAGDADGGGRGFIFIAPTERPSKVDGAIRPYRWVVAPDVEVLALVGGDHSGAALREAATAAHRPEYTGPSYDGPDYADLTPDQQAEADLHLAGIVSGWRALWERAEEWGLGETDTGDVGGRGWEALSRDWAWACARMAATPWLGLDEDAARGLHDEVLPAAVAVDDKCAGKWFDGIVAKAGAEPIEPPPWEGLGPPADDDRYTVDVASDSASLRWLKAEVGRGRLSGLFRRGAELVHTPRIGEDGYVPPKDDRDSNGPAQVRRIGDLELAGRIDHGYRVVRVSTKGIKDAVFPQPIAARAAAAPDLLPNVRDLLGVTHTPVVRADGSVLDTPGYDPQSGMLYLPDAGLAVPEVPRRPSRAQVQTAGELLLRMVADFPFITPHDRANYLGALLTPLLRPLVPPPYKLVAIGAPQRGSGKTLLAWIARELHGGVFKSDFPSTDDELRKFITSTLDATTAPVVQFDNVTGVLKSAVLDGLLSSADWSDRPLGRTAMVSLRNDRFWIVTGNNVHIGGDLERRTLWITINANMERPETRASFAIPHLEAWVRARRGDLLWALLVLVRAWVVAGKPLGVAPESTDFGRWIAALRGILEVAGFGESVGLVGHEDSVRGAADPDDEEWAAFLAAVHRVFGSEPWTAAELLERVHWKASNREMGEAATIGEEELPGDVAEKLMRTGGLAAKSLGKWLAFRDGRWAGGLSAQSVGSRRGSKLWRLAAAGDL